MECCGCRHFKCVVLLFPVLSKKYLSMFIMVSNALFIGIKSWSLFFSCRELKKINNQAQFNPSVLEKSPHDVIQPEEMSLSQVSSGQHSVPCFRKGTVCLRRFPSPSARVLQWQLGNSVTCAEICQNGPPGVGVLPVGAQSSLFPWEWLPKLSITTALVTSTFHGDCGRKSWASRLWFLCSDF